MSVPEPFVAESGFISINLTIPAELTAYFKNSMGNFFLTCDFCGNLFREFDHFGFEFLCCRVFALVVVFEELNIQNLIFNIRII